MGQVKSVIATAAATGGQSNWQLGGVIDGRVKCIIDSYVGLGTETAGTTILVGPLLPIGANIINIQIQVSANTTSLTMSVGDLNSATRYASALTGPATAGTPTFAPGKLYIIGTNDVSTTNTDRQILITTGGATLGTGTVYTFIITYSFD